MCERGLGIAIATSKMSAKMFSPKSEIPITISVPSNVASATAREIERRACKKTDGPSVDFMYALEDCIVNYPEIVRDIMMRHDMADEVLEAYSERRFAQKYSDNYKYLCKGEVKSWYELWCRYSFADEYPDEFKSLYSTKPVESWSVLWKCHRKLDFMDEGGTISENDARDIFQHIYNHEYEQILQKSGGAVKSWINILKFRNTTGGHKDWFESLRVF